MINYRDYKTLYVAAPANFASGGPELLHQLCYKLRDKGVNCKIYYYGEHTGSPVHAFYEKYALPYETSVANSEENLLIIPETFLDPLLDEALNKVKKAIWWLSVDNYFVILEMLKKRQRRHMNVFQRLLKRYSALPDLQYLQTAPIYHLAQSHYAVDFLHKHNINKVGFLSDYLSEYFFKQYDAGVIKKNQVLYNPKKGLKFTKRLMKAAPHIHWKPIENMTPQQVAAAFNDSKVYIDFGHHPGKDRFPREAATMHCCVITSKFGSAVYKEDVPIADEYKFDAATIAIQGIINKIQSCFKDYPAHDRQFDAYREIIKGEEAAFEQQVDKVFEI